MALSQIQIIRSLGEALTWFEKELAWGVKPAELNHLTGRIGELYAAMITRGQMALATNQHGYDVVSADREHISVKTVTSANHVSFKKSTFHHVHRVLVLRLNVDEDEGEVSIEELLDSPAAHIAEVTAESDTDYTYRIRQGERPRQALEELVLVAEATHGPWRILQYENGTMAVTRDGAILPQAKPALREIAAELGVPLVNGNGNPANTRQLGAAVLAALQVRQ